MAVNFTTLFTRLGHFFFVADGIGTALGTTAPTRVDAALQGLGSSLPNEYEAVRQTVLGGLTALQQSGAAGNGALVQTPVQQLILLTVQDDTPVANTLDLAIRELIRQMIVASESLDVSTVGSSVAYLAANIGNGKLVASTKRADGKDCLFAFAEAVRLTCTNVANGQATFTASAPAVIDPLMPTWPGGSGTTQTTTSKTASSGDNKVTNGTFEDNDTLEPNLPAGWLAPVATFGSRLILSSVEIQTVIISGTPTAGYYTLSWVNGASETLTTSPLSFDAGQSDVQNALQALPGLEAVDVVTTGTTPNYTHTITFTGVTNPAQLTSTNSTTGGTITHNTTTAGSANVFRGARAVEFASNATELTTLMVPVSLTALTQYVCNLFVKCSTNAPAAGVLTIDLVDGVGGSVINDQQGAANSFTFGHASFTTSFQAVNGVFRTPASLPSQIYLRIRISTAITNATSLYIDEVFLGQADSLYQDGPELAIFDGSTAWLAGDVITLTVTNDRGGTLHEYLDRLFGLRESGLQFPVSGSPTQSDALIA